MMDNRQNTFLIDKLESKLAEFELEDTNDSLVSIAAAVEEVYSSVERLSGVLRLKEASLSPGDYDGLLEIVTDLRELFEHLTEHCQEASSALWELSDEVAGKLEYSGHR
jgi:hypothetical protein